jgi:gluconolactonase
MPRPCRCPSSVPVRRAVAPLLAVVAATIAAVGPVRAEDPPRGEVASYTFASSRVFPGTVREYWVYVPAKYDGRTPACVHVNQDGIQFDAPKVFDRLIHEGRMPVTIGVFVMHGRVPAGREGALDRYNRSYEYDGLGDAYARFLLDELLPDVETRKTDDGRPIVLSKRGADRSIGGTSSGAIAAFTAAWERPDAFSRVFSGIGTYVGLRGGNEYPTLLRKTEPRPIRVFLQGGEKDLNIYGGDWWIANQAMERSLTFAGYEVKHAWGEGGHDGKHATELFPEAMEWLWKDWPAAPGRGAGSPQLQEILLPGEEWRRVGEGYGHAAAPAADDSGRVIFTDTANRNAWALDADWEPRSDASRRPSRAQAFAPDGRLASAGTDGEAVVIGSPDAPPRALARGWQAGDLVVAADGVIWATEPADASGQGTIHRITPDGADTVVDRFPVPGTPGGICLSPDQTLLYVADGTSHWVYSYSIDADGTLENRQRYYHLHVPDDADDAGAGGMRVDREGRLWVATRMGLQVCDQAGRVNCIVPVPSGRATDLCFAGPDFDTVVVTCGRDLWARKVRVRGAPAFQSPSTPAKPRL